MAEGTVWRWSSVAGRLTFVAFTDGEQRFKMEVRCGVKSDEIIVGLERYWRCLRVLGGARMRGCFWFGPSRHSHYLFLLTFTRTYKPLTYCKRLYYALCKRTGAYDE
jgi:hypothetical protein